MIVEVTQILNICHSILLLSCDLARAQWNITRLQFMRYNCLISIFSKTFLALYGITLAPLIRSNTNPQALPVPLSSVNPVPYVLLISYCLSKSNCVIKKYSNPGNVMGLSAWPFCKPLLSSSFFHTLICSLMYLRISGGLAVDPCPSGQSRRRG